ncbi:MAG: tetratricopeptide repeat protein [Alphaproteobacteria bacterium]|nr:tetratricopeptide repeat protein [Alphaproteobacteria bacterium]
MSAPLLPWHRQTLPLLLLAVAVVLPTPVKAADAVSHGNRNVEADEPAQAAFVSGALDNAVALRREALRASLSNVAGDPAAAAQAMASLARLYIDEDRYLDAEPLLLAARQLLAEHEDGNSAAMAVIQASLARVDLARGDVKPAVACATEAAALVQRDADDVSSEPLRVLGSALAADHQYARGDKVLQQAVARARAEFGPQSLETARDLAELARLYLHADRPAEALPLIEEATAIDQHLFARGHPFIGDDLLDLGLIYEALKKPELAKRAMIAAFDSLEGGAARDTPRVAYVETDLSRVLREAGETEAADAAFADARRILKKTEAEERKRERDA